ncbi:hypothetical protein AWC17_20355 [Mycobacterium nebraskense]|uniref:Uncharacterized protein n=1 Tax=Mycobacterium nebraskense TaxID=244292 RepID=A0A1X1YTA0_9MYCO|nr:hypothetical protein AWC13_26625 [Mycobacterium kubicae]ORW14250.1 hypothetical protein AWC17_20355 [Mycobacterium nebraskense]
MCRAQRHDRSIGGGVIDGQRRKQPRHSRVGGHDSEQVALRTDCGHIGQTVTTERDRDRHVKQHLARIMAGPRQPPRPQRPR